MKNIKDTIVLFFLLLIIFNCTQIGDVGSDSKKKRNIADDVSPVITKFNGPLSIVYNAVIDIQLEGNDNVGISGWLINNSASTPLINDGNWKSEKPSNFTLPATGDYTLYAWAKDNAGNISTSLSINVSYRLDNVPPVITLFTGPGVTISHSKFDVNLDASDNIGITGWLLTKTSTVPSVNDTNWKTVKPDNYKLPGTGSYNIYAWVKDQAGNINSPVYISVNYESSDNEPPVITSFTGPSGSVNNKTININITGKDNVEVTGWLLSDNLYSPQKDDANWQDIKPSTYTVTKTGSNNIYAWLKDEAGNISSPENISFTFNDIEAPVVTVLNAPKETSDSAINIDLDATDNIGIAGWLVNESSTPPDVNDSKWKKIKPASYSLTKKGKTVLYAWAKDSSGNISDYKSVEVNKIANWTILVQLAIDNDIDYSYEKNYGVISSMLQNLETQKQMDTDDNVNVLVLMDCYNNDTTFKDGYYCLKSGTFNNDIEVGKTEINSGSVSDLNSFNEWAIQNYPAMHYLYTIVGEGSGFDDVNINGTDNQSVITTSNKAPKRCLSMDETQNDSLSHYELGKVCEHFQSISNKKIEIFFAYSWLMGGVELAYELKDNVNYLLASEEIFPVDSWSPAFVESIINNPSISTVDIGKNICDSAESYFAAKSTNFTLSFVDLSKMPALYSDINSFAAESISYIGKDSAKANYFNNAAETSFIMCSSFNVKYYYIDMGSFFNNITGSSNVSASAKALANQVIYDLSDAVIYKKNFGYPNASGLSIFHNIWYSPFQYSPVTYGSILSFGKNKWTNYLTLVDSLKKQIDGDKYEPDDDFTTSNIMKPGADRQYHTLHTKDDVDDIKLDLTKAAAGSSYKIETYYDSIKTNTQIYLYDSKGNLLSYDNDSGEMGVYSKIIWQCNTPGIYHVRIKQSGNLNNGDYSIDFVQM